MSNHLPDAEVGFVSAAYTQAPDAQDGAWEHRLPVDCPSGCWSILENSMVSQAVQLGSMIWGAKKNILFPHPFRYFSDVRFHVTSPRNGLVEPCNHTRMAFRLVKPLRLQICNNQMHRSNHPPSCQVCSLGLGNNQHCGANLGWREPVGDQTTPQDIARLGFLSTKKATAQRF